MPSYPSWGTHYAHSRLPPTPPEYNTSYLTPTNCRAADEAHNWAANSYMPRPLHSTREYDDGFATWSQYPSQTVLPIHSRPKHVSNSQDYRLGYAHQLVPQYYGPMAAPILPPMRVTDDVQDFHSQYANAHGHVAPYAHPEPEHKPKEEKPTGGVAQHLDYEMELMASFVAETAQHIVTESSLPTSQFRKYVFQILSSTRLPSSTIMLGLFYLQERMKILADRGEAACSSSGTVYRMLTTCLLLGSKFLDDNTFQNRSWAEVSSISVAELNTMELDWLKDFNWEIHRLMYEREEGFFAWVDHWHEYESKAQIVKAKDAHKPTPIETNCSRHHPSPLPLMSPEGPIPAQYLQNAQYDTQWVRPYMSDYSPPSAPDSGPTTPEDYAHRWAYPQAPQSFARGSWHHAKMAYGPNRAHTFHYQPAAYMLQSHGHTGWAGHGAQCGCTLCIKPSEFYPYAQPAFGIPQMG